jgi:hypothetical protein
MVVVCSSKWARISVNFLFDIDLRTLYIIQIHFVQIHKFYKWAKSSLLTYPFRSTTFAPYICPRSLSSHTETR